MPEDEQFEDPNLPSNIIIKEFQYRMRAAGATLENSELYMTAAILLYLDQLYLELHKYKKPYNYYEELNTEER